MGFLSKIKREINDLFCHHDRMIERVANVERENKDLKFDVRLLNLKVRVLEYDKSNPATFMMGDKIGDDIISSSFVGERRERKEAASIPIREEVELARFYTVVSTKTGKQRIVREDHLIDDKRLLEGKNPPKK